VRLTDFDAFPNCRALTNDGTTNLGVDPNFNGDIHLRTPADIMDDPPVISPDGAQWWVGSYDGGFTFEGVGGYDARGSLIGFNSVDGSFHANNPRYGWQVAPTALSTGPGRSAYRWLMDENLFSLFDLKVAVNDQDMNPISSGGPLDPPIFTEFVDTHITFGASGDHYAVAAGGRFYKFNASSQIVEVVPLTRLDGSSIDDDTESVYVAADRRGCRYVPSGGLIHVVCGGGPLQAPPSVASAPSARLTSQRRAKMAAATRVVDPGPPSSL
jgi:hypothetical protein